MLIEKQTKEQLIQKYREMGKKYEELAHKLPEPVRSSHLRIADTLYKTANKLEGEKDEW